MNLKKRIHDKKYKIARFAEEELDCNYDTFNWRLVNGHFLLKDIVICMEVLDISLKELLEPVELPNRKEYVRNKDIEALDYAKLESLLK